MAKRRRLSPHSESDDNWRTGEISSSPTDSEYEDASNRTKRGTLGNKKRKSADTRKRVKSVRVDASGHLPSTEPQTLCVKQSSHPKSTHTILSPGSARTALLDWYKTVHDARGMPWRKPYNPTLDPNERAQRAYEVRLPILYQNLRD